MYITNKVSDTTIKGDGIFSYNINVSYTSEKSEVITPKVTIFFPEFITYVLPKEDDIINNIDVVTESNGDKVTFNLLERLYSVNYNFNINAYFNDLRENGENFNCSASLYIDDVFKEVAISENTALELLSEFNVSIQSDDLGNKYRGDTFLVTTNLLQLYDWGTNDKNLVLDYNIEGFAIIDESFTPIIVDKSSKHVDEHVNNIVPVINDEKNNITFNLDYYKGEELEIVYQVLIEDTASYNDKIIVDLDFSSDNTKLTTYSTEVELKFSESRMDFAMNAIDVNAINSLATTHTILRNNSAYQLTECELIVALVKGTYLKNYKFDMDKEAISSYSVYYMRHLGEDYELVYENLTESLEKTNTDDYITDDDYVTNIKITFDTLEIGTEINMLTCQIGTFPGISWTSSNSLISQLWFLNDEGDYSFTLYKNITVSTESDYKISLINENNTVELEGQDYIPLQINIKPTYQPSINPVVIYELMKGFEIDESSVSYSYYDDFDDVTYYSDDPLFPLDLNNIITEILDDPDGSGNKLLRFSFNNISVVKNTELIIYFTVKYIGDEENYFNNYAYSGGVYTPAANSLLISDINDYDNDVLINDFIYETRPLIFSDIGESSAINTDGSVTLNGVDYYDNINVNVDDEFIYAVNLSDSNSVELKDVTIISIMPHNGDSLITNPNISRGSDSNIYLNGDVILKIRDNDTSTLSDTSDYEILYSTGYDPMRLNYLNEEIGTDLWTDEKPDDYTEIKSFKIITSSDFILHSNETLVLFIPSKMVAINKEDNVCLNTFSINSNAVINGENVQIVPFETNSITTNLFNGSIDGFTWIDINNDGIYDSDESKINGILVSLYDESKNLISEVITSTDNVYGDGYYRFNYVLDGNYYIKFENPLNYHPTIQNLTDVNGSKIDPDLEYNPVALKDYLYNYNAGFNNSLLPSDPIIKISTSIVLEGSLFDPYSIVTAYDYLGDDITGKVIVTENNVNPDVLGNYTVTYEVTDDYNNKSLATFTFSVLSSEQIDRYNAISDIYMSHALISAAIANILNSESKKIDEVIESDPILDELIDVNDSVNYMVQAVTNLEVTSSSGMKIFDTCC